MRSVRSQAILIFGLTLVLWTTSASSDDTMDVRVYNDTAEEIVVTLYDMNATPPGPVLVRQTIDGFA